MKDNKLTIKERILVQKFIMERGNATEAGMKTFNVTSRQSAEVLARKTLSRPRVKKALTELLEEQGLDDNSLVKIHSELLNDPHPAIRLKALEMAYKLQGRYETKIILEEHHKESIKTPVKQTPLLTSEEMERVMKSALQSVQTTAEYKAQRKAERQD